MLWSNSLILQANFETQTAKAITLALKLSGGAPKITLLWLYLTTVEAPDVTPEEASLNDPGQMEGNIEAGQAIFINYLMADDPTLSGNDVPEDAHSHQDIAPPIKFICEVPKVWCPLLSVCHGPDYDTPISRT